MENLCIANGTTSCSEDLKLGRVRKATRALANTQLFAPDRDITGPAAPTSRHHLDSPPWWTVTWSSQLTNLLFHSVVSVKVFYHFMRKPVVPGNYTTCPHLLCRQNVVVMGREVMCHSKLVTNNMVVYTKSRIRKDKLTGRYLPSPLDILHLLLSSYRERSFQFLGFLHWLDFPVTVRWKSLTLLMLFEI